MASRTTDPLSSATRLLANAKRSTETLRSGIYAHKETVPFKMFLDTEPGTGYRLIKVRLENPVPDEIIFAGRDALHDLRQSLDHAGYACAAARTPLPRKTHFPFSRSKTNLATVLKKNSKDIPQEILDVMVAARPYADDDGDKLLYALNNIRNINEHRLLVPYGGAANSGGSFRNYMGIEPLPYSPVLYLFEPQTIVPPLWNEARQEMTLVRFDERIHPDWQYESVSWLVFGPDIDFLWLQSPTIVMDKLIPTVEGILTQIREAAERARIF